MVMITITLVTIFIALRRKPQGTVPKIVKRKKEIQNKYISMYSQMNTEIIKERLYSLSFVLIKLFTTVFT